MRAIKGTDFLIERLFLKGRIRDRLGRDGREEVVVGRDRSGKSARIIVNSLKLTALGRGAKKVPHNGRRFRGFSTQWKRVPGFFPYNGSMFRPLFHTMETCFATVFPRCGKVAAERLGGSGGWDCNRVRGGVEGKGQEERLP
jgi:hypothetical protein